jgi:predicted small metal-binding protein
MKKRIACSDVVPGCPFTASAETEEDLLRQVAAHAEHSHGIKEVTPDLLGKVKGAIRPAGAAE